MAQKLSEYLGISEEILINAGVFDPILSVDSKFFIDPKSLETTSVPEFKDAREKLSNRYSQIFELLSLSKNKKDKFWTAAFQHFPQGEVEEICVGHGFDTTGGHGIGPVLVEETLDTIQEFIRVGLVDPLLLELVGMFQKGIGSDLVSDMIATTLLKDIQKYTTRMTDVIAKETKIKPVEYKVDGITHHAFYNPHNDKMVYLLPSEILQPIPVAEDWESIDKVSRHNYALRQAFAKMLGAYNWRSTRYKSKELLKNAMIAYPEVVTDLIDQYTQKDAKPAYDFKTDPDGEYRWLEEAKNFTDGNPLKLDKALTPTDVDAIVRRIIDSFHDFVENKGGWTSFYTKGENKKIMHESYAQKLFYGIADSYCNANNLDISPETNGGKGPVDFKFSHGKKAKVLVEVKLTSSQQLAHGFTTQVAEYEKVEKPFSSYYLVLEVTDPKNYSDKLNTAIAEALDTTKRTPKVHYVNANVQKSASIA